MAAAAAIEGYDSAATTRRVTTPIARESAQRGILDEPAEALATHVLHLAVHNGRGGQPQRANALVAIF